MSIINRLRRKFCSGGHEGVGTTSSPFLIMCMSSTPVNVHYIHRHVCHAVLILVSCPGGAPASRCPPVCRPCQRQHLPVFPGMTVLEPAMSWIEDT
jgi:hypothetical protein